jgi:hypothetical protein
VENGPAFDEASKVECSLETHPANAASYIDKGALQIFHLCRKHHSCN